MRITFDKVDTRDSWQVEGMTLVWLNILRRDEVTSRVVISRLKEGSYQDSSNILLHHTFLYVFDLRIFKKCLTLKALELDNKLGLGIGEDIDMADIVDGSDGDSLEYYSVEEDDSGCDDGDAEDS